MPAYNRSFLNEEEKERYGRRLTHFLEDYTFRHKLTHAAAAKKLGISTNKFSQLKSGGEQGRFLTSLDYLKSIANLDGLSLPDFIDYIEGLENKESPAKKYSWADKIYRALESMSLLHRGKFVDAMQKAASRDNERLELICRLSTAVADKDIKVLRGLVEAMENLD